MATLREMRQDLIRAYRGEIEKLRAQLDAFDKLGMRRGERKSGGQWIDITDREIQRLKDEIASYESTIARLEKEMTDA